MYVNQIDNIIDKILDNLYLEGLSKDPAFQSIVAGKRINYVEYREKINQFIRQFMDTIDVDAIRQLINNKENLDRILDIIKRYVAYYYFLSIAFYYTGSFKEYRNNLIQYSKLQETSQFTIKNFFDTENNYQIIYFFRIIKDVSHIITMTELQKKTLNPLQVKDAINFLNNLGKDFIDNYLLTIATVDGEQVVQINVHNLIKTIVFREIYRNQEQSMVFEILNDVEENKYEYTFIDIVVTVDEASDYESFRQMFLGYKQSETIAKDLYELINDTNRIPSIQTPDTKNSNLIEFNMITPIVDDFLRYHRDSERLDADIDKPFVMPLTSNNNSKNIQLALLYQQRKKKENTKAQLIVNKIDAISDYYSDNVKDNPTTFATIKKYFQNPLANRKAVMHNYLEEVRVMNKIFNQGRRAMEGNEYFLELQHAIRHAYFNFKDFKKYGTMVNVNSDQPINMLRYTNIENQNQLPHLELDMHTGVADHMVSVVGLAIGPIDDGPIQCTRIENLVDIRNIKFNYRRPGSDTITTIETENGFDAFLKLIRYLFIETIQVSISADDAETLSGAPMTDSNFRLYHDFNEMRKLNPSIFDKVIYWIYDVEKDQFEMETFEALKGYSFQETIRFMNALVYDKITYYLSKKLNRLINDNLDLPIRKIELLIQLYSIANRLFLKSDEKRELIIREYFAKKPPELYENPTIANPTSLGRIEMPEYKLTRQPNLLLIKVDMVNPLHPQPYIKLQAYGQANKEMMEIIDSKCKHEDEWNEITKLKNENLNVYNEKVTQFIEKFAIETATLEFVCQVCGQVLPLRQYIQDGSFDNNTQKFVTAYVPIDIPLDQIKEYGKYHLMINYIDILINRVSLWTNTNMLVGSIPAIVQKRKALVKNIIDLIIKHNSVNIRKNNEERLEFYSKKFHIDKDLDSVYFFELDNNILNFTPSAADTNIELNKLKFNNILLYFMIIFMTELNGAQITMMSNDKYGNIYIFLKYGSKLFGDLLIKKNINGTETIPIVRYPVLCYLVFLISYYLIKYKLWFLPTTTTKAFNPVYQKIIINSFVDLFNSIATDAGRFPNDYIYLLTTSKLYSQLADTFKNNEIINVLKRNQAKYSDKSVVDNLVPVVANAEQVSKIIYYIKDAVKTTPKPIKLANYKISSGIQYDEKPNIIYPATKSITDITNCPYGSYHEWHAVGKDIICAICKENGNDDNGQRNRLDDSYYYNLNTIANRRCLSGNVHDFVSQNGKYVCTICHRESNIRYTQAELDTLSDNLAKLENENIQRILNLLANRRARQATSNAQRKQLMEDLRASYRKETSDKLYGQINMLIDKLVRTLALFIGADTNLDIDKYPVYLIDNVYIIDHLYNGTPLENPIILTEKDNRFMFKEDQPFFKTDVYYYTDRRTEIDVFYHAVTLKLLGYKEKFKEYVRTNADVYLKISPSIKNRLLTIGYETKYIDIGEIFIKNSKLIKDTNQNYFEILDNLIRAHIFKIKTVIDKFESILYKIKNYQPISDTETAQSFLPSAQILDKIVAKYAKIFKNLDLDDAFAEWNSLRDLFSYNQINWPETNIRPPITTDKSLNMYVNTELINYYDISSNLMIYYLTNQLLSILENQDDNTGKINISQMYVEIITYIYNLYNMEKYKHSIELKRFEYILNGSDMMVDMLKKGQGLIQSKELEDQLNNVNPDISENVELTEEQMEEQEDLKEEAEALDVESDYFAEEDEDYAQEGEGE